MIPELITLSEAARVLNLGPRKMVAAMKARKIIDQHRLPNWRYTQQGFFKVETKAFNHPARGLQHTAKTLVTPTGVEFLRQQFADQIELERAS